jgi:putative FmdB family regulatory protein
MDVQFKNKQPIKQWVFSDTCIICRVGPVLAPEGNYEYIHPVMPTYDYECRSCGHSFETFQSMSDNPLTTCPECGEEQLRRLISGGTGIIFKGSGFYVNDSRKSSSTSMSGKSGSESKKTDNAGGKKSDVKKSASKDSKTSGTGSGESSGKASA